MYKLPTKKTIDSKKKMAMKVVKKTAVTKSGDAKVDAILAVKTKKKVK